MPTGVYIRTEECNQAHRNTLSDVWNKINKKSDEECWEWKGATTKGGYGSMKLYNKTKYVHRVVYEITYGKFSNDLDVLHKCDNPLCCNPEHLFLGTQQDNVRDMDVKGRRGKTDQKGELNNASKLTKTDIEKIRELNYSGSYSQREIGEIFGVGQQCICLIVNHKTWKHI